MVERIETLTNAQAAQMDAYADRWIEIALRTGPVPRRSVTKIGRRSCELAGLPWHDNAVVVSSPVALALAAPIAAFLIPWQRQGLPAAAVNGPVGAAVGAAIRAAADNLAERAAGTVRASVRSAIHAAVLGARPSCLPGSTDGAASSAPGCHLRAAPHGRGKARQGLGRQDFQEPAHAQQLPAAPASVPLRLER